MFLSVVTYLDIDEGVDELALVAEDYSPKIRVYHLNYAIETSDTVKVLQRAVVNSVTKAALIYRSGRGFQTCSGLDQKQLSKHNIKLSMADSHDCYHNVLTERDNGVLTQVFLLYRCMTFEKPKVCGTVYRYIIIKG